MLAPPPDLSGNINYVKPTASGNNDGTAWTDAHKDLHTALQAATAGDSVWVANGLYFPSFSDRDVYFELKNGVALLGGFNGTEAHLSERDWQLHPSIFNGDIGVVGDSTDNSHTLLYIGTSDSTTIVDGFYFYSAVADGDLMDSFHPNNCGAAIYIYAKGSYAYPTIRNCHFERNTSVNYGGAVYINGRSGSVAPQFINCFFVTI